MDLGNELRLNRKKQDITINQLAGRTGLSTGYLSNIERNLNSPTIENLRKIVDALGISLVELLEDGKEEARVVRSNERKTIVCSEHGDILYELLSPSKNKQMEAMIKTLKPGAESGAEPHKHKGEDFGFLIQGTMLYTVGDEEYILNEGDSIYFDSTIPHYYKNIGEDISVSIWVVTPPSF